MNFGKKILEKYGYKEGDGEQFDEVFAVFE